MEGILILLFILLVGFVFVCVIAPIPQELKNPKESPRGFFKEIFLKIKFYWTRTDVFVSEGLLKLNDWRLKEKTLLKEEFRKEKEEMRGALKDIF